MYIYITVVPENTMNARLRIAEPDIVKLFEASPSKVLRRSQIADILLQNRKFWRLSDSTTLNKFIEFLSEHTKLSRIKFEFPYRPEIRYMWGDVSTYEVILTLRPDSYFTHFTAMFLHELTEQIPKTVYLNEEQQPKPHRVTTLTQTSIDSAFRRPVRVSSNVASYKDIKICLLNGMHTGKLGVIEGVGPQGEKIHLTDSERTLIDITVRPVYSGGVFEVLKAYRLARAKVSVNKLSAMLQMLNYAYPYHQAVGFYLERAGVYRDSSLALLRKFEMKYDFYLAHAMKDRSYSEKWRLYYPKGL